MKRTCLILGVDGFDVDVLINVVHLYERLGFKVIYSRKMILCDLLVIMRGTDETLTIDNAAPLHIHVFQYSGKRIDKLIDSLKNHNVTMIGTRPIAEMSKKAFMSSINYVESPPPVYPHLWTAKDNGKNINKYEIIHIGHYKPFLKSTDDIYGQNFLKTITDLNVHVWGKNWEDAQVPKELRHGKANVHNVSSIYQQANFAIGLMYPFQRDATFSGRFWHGPLNGCPILSEPSAYSKRIPGIIESDLSPEHIREQLSLVEHNRKEIQEKSINYWNQSTTNLEQLLAAFLPGEKLKKSRSLDIRLKVAIAAMKNSIKNFLRKYQ